MKWLKLSLFWVQFAANKNFCLRIPVAVMMLVVGFMVVGSSFADEVDRRLDGTWVFAKNGGEFEIRLNNGNFEQSIRIPKLYSSGLVKGTYTTNNGKFIQTVTHVHGSYFDLLVNSRVRWLEKKWYSIADLIVTIKSEALRSGANEREVNGLVEKMVSKYTSKVEISYVVDGKTLIMTGEEGVTIFTKK